jgi:hypothetical protein
MRDGDQLLHVAPSINTQPLGLTLRQHFGDSGLI